MRKNPRELLDTAAGTRIPADVNLYPRILQAVGRIDHSPNNNRRTLMQTLRARPALAFLLVLLALALLSGVAYAITRSLGYIPGVGIVEQGASLRVLAEPVSLTREGITLTVTSATLAPDKTILTYTIENVPWEALSHQEDVPGCYAEGQIRLPNGSLLTPQSGGGGMSADGKWETRMEYSAIPPQFNEAEFLLDCIRETLPGKAPENWRLTLRFIPAPPDLTIVPVVEIPTPTPAPQRAEPPAASEPVPFVITQAMQIGEKTILLGLFVQPGDGTWIEQRAPLRVTNANGQEVFTIWPTVPNLPPFDWGVEFQSAQAYPLTLTWQGARVSTLPGSAEIIFDAGENPQPGQEWPLNQEIEISGRTVMLVSVSADSRNGYQFHFRAGSDVTGLQVELPGYTPIGGGGGGADGEFSVALTFETLPKGKLRVVLSQLAVAGPLETWSLQWQPENAPQAGPLYGIRLVLDKFIPLKDGYYLIGHTEASDGRITKAVPAGWPTATDESGRSLALETVTFGEVLQLTEKLDESTWVYKLYGQAFQGSITLRLDTINVRLTQPVPLILDLRPAGFSFETARVGTPFKTGLIPLDFPALSAQLYKATVFQQGELRGFELAFQADPRLDGIVFEMDYGGSAMSNSYRDPQSGDLLVQAATDPAPLMPFRLTATELRLKGDWSLSWTPPAPPAGATPFYAPHTCLTLDTVKAAFANPLPLSPLMGRILLMRGALYPEPSLFLRDLASGKETPLVFGDGSLSPDGSTLVYADQQNRLILRDLATGAETALTDGAQPDSVPLWSPDGARIAFLRTTAKGSNVFIFNLAENASRPLTDQANHPALSGWADNQTLLLQEATNIELLNVADGSRRLLLQTRYQPYGSPTAAISPDGKTLAYLETVPGKMMPGLYLKSLPSGEPRLLAQLEHWAIFNPLFSPDSRWLAFSIMNTDLSDAPVTLALVPLAEWPGGCPLYPLPFTGQARVWQP
ncbi:MAG: DPP IV N-terminal domain-containing protein [Anaerolineales bacterium]|nr:DPP IV N-terminal domain-containing protein [Anaerolineales bacterium]